MMAAVIVLALGFVVDQLLGDPRYAMHPVRLAGHWIGWLEGRLRGIGLANYTGGGLLYLGACLLPLMLVGGSLWLVRGNVPAGILVGGFWIYSSLGLKDLCAHARPIAAALESGELALARQRVGMIVGREVDVLDAAGVARAAIESVAENFVDACLAPLFCFVVGALGAALAGGDALLCGVILVVLHRITNTLDAMVGYRNEKYIRLGCVSARLDDVLNFLPARLSIPVIAGAAIVTGHDFKGTLRIGCRDRLKHPSPNSAHAESAVAGCLGIALGGPTQYRHGVTDKAWLGGEGRTPEPGDIQRTVRVVSVAAWGALLGGSVLLLVVV